MPLGRLLLLFFVSGACGLIYQVVWMRALALSLSVTVYAVTTVLCAFMGGLALGAALAGRMVDRLERPLLVFGLIEIGVGVVGLAAPGVLFGLGPAYVWLHDLLGSSGIAFALGRFLLAGCLLLVPCTLMGMTLPLLSRAAIESDAFVGRGAGSLYAVNTLGAVAGCVAAGFALISALGLFLTSVVAACLNLTVGSIAVVLGRRARRTREMDGADPTGPGPMPPAARLAAVAFGVSGFTALGYEVLWTRALEQFTHNSTYAYSAMLATFLFGIGGGSALMARRADHTRDPLPVLGGIQIAIAFSVFVSLAIYPALLSWIPATAAAVGGLGTWGRALGLMFGVSGVTLLATTLLFGAAFPLVARAMVDRIDFVGRRIATAYTVNTLASIAGAVTVGFWLLPVLGLQGAFLALLVLNAATGATLVWMSARRSLALPAVALAATTVLLTAFVIPTDLFRKTFEARYGELQLYHEQVTDIVMVTEGPKDQYVIRYGDGRGTAGTITALENRSYAHIGMMLHPNPRHVLSICFGVGNTLSSVAQYPVERIDALELSPGAIEAAPFFRSTNRDVLLDPRLHVTIEDGRNFLLTSHDRYDVIQLEPPELHTAGVVNLYTLEFFEMARDHLAPGGLFSIWVNIAITPEEDLRAIVRTAAEAFPHVSVWHSPELYAWVINGSVDPHAPDLRTMARHFEDLRVRADLASIGIDEPAEFLHYFVMADEDVWSYALDAPVVTDDRTQLDFTVARSIESDFGLFNSNTNDWLLSLTRPDRDLGSKLLAMCRHKRPVTRRVLDGGAPLADGGALEARLKAVGQARTPVCVDPASR
ncbi:MAG: fused MFS/spermidine synthase [Myxococcota bacterium]